MILSLRHLLLAKVLAYEERNVMRREVLAILCCPEDHCVLKPASELLISETNNAIRRGQLRNRAGRLVERTLDGGLANASGSLIYPIFEGIPVLVREEAIPLDQLKL